MTGCRGDRLTGVKAAPGHLVTRSPCRPVTHDDTLCHPCRRGPNRDLRHVGLVARSLRERAALADRGRVSMGLAAGDRAGATVRAGLANPTGALAAWPRPGRLGAGATGGGAGQ